MTELHFVDKSGKVVGRKVWKMGAESRPPTSKTTDTGYYTVSTFDPGAKSIEGRTVGAWIYRLTN